MDLTTDKYTVTPSITRLPNVVVSSYADGSQSMFTSDYHDNAYSANPLIYQTNNIHEYVEQDKSYHDTWNANRPSTPAERKELSTLSMPPSPHNGNGIATISLVLKEDASTVVQTRELYDTSFSEATSLQTEVSELPETTEQVMHSEDSENVEPRFLDEPTDSSPRGDKTLASSKIRTVSNVFQKLIEQYRESRFVDRSDDTADNDDDTSTNNPVSLIEML